MGRIEQVIGAWVRLVLAIHLVVGLVLLPLGWPVRGLGGGPLGFFEIALLALPPAVLHRALVRKEAPFLKRGYWLVVVYGPALWLVALLPGGGLPLAGLLTIALAYQLGALLITGVCIFLWRLGDAALDRLPERLRGPGGRGLASAGLALLLVYAPYVASMGERDHCLDLGGRLGADGRCELAAPELAHRAADARRSSVRTDSGS